MKIKKISLIGNGMKGVSIVWEKPEEKDSRHFSTDVKEDKKYPIHLGLENKFKELRTHLADICGYTPNGIQDEQIPYIINDIEVTSVQFENDYFQLNGTKTSFADEKMPAKTHRVREEHEYPQWDAIWKIIGELVDETKAYMDGTKKATDEEIGRRYIQSQLKKGKEVTSLDEFEGMSADEQKEFCTKFLEKSGSLVQHFDDLQINEEDAVVMNLQKAV